MIERFNMTLNKRFEELDSSIKRIITEVWSNKDKYIHWPDKAILLWVGKIRNKYHKYPDDIKIKLKSKNIKIDSRSNGPAVNSYLFSGGKRPSRAEGNKEWSIHHIYDGKFPFMAGKQTLHAVKNGNHFTQSAGLVAIHPIAEALADEIFYFAWVLRQESFKRFNYDPDKIFCREVDYLGFKCT